jgi:hypothetical protein
MVAFALLHRLHDKEPEVDAECSPLSLRKHLTKEARFIIFLTLTLVAVMLLQNSLTKLMEQFTLWMFPGCEIKQSVLQLAIAVQLTPLITLLALF